MEFTDHFQWGSFIIGILFSTAIIVVVDLIRTKLRLRESKLEVEQLKKSKTKKEKKEKGKKGKQN